MRRLVPELVAGSRRRAVLRLAEPAKADRWNEYFPTGYASSPPADDAGEGRPGAVPELDPVIFWSRHIPAPRRAAAVTARGRPAAVGRVPRRQPGALPPVRWSRSGTFCDSIRAESILDPFLGSAPPASRPCCRQAVHRHRARPVYFDNACRRIAEACGRGRRGPRVSQLPARVRGYKHRGLGHGWNRTHGMRTDYATQRNTTTMTSRDCVPSGFDLAQRLWDERPRTDRGRRSRRRRSSRSAPHRGRSTPASGVWSPRHRDGQDRRR